MITTVLIAHPWMTTLALVGLVLLGPPLGAWLTGRPRVAGGLAVVALLPVALLTLVPTARDLPVTCAVEWSAPALGRVELMANLVLFVPPVLFAAVATRRPLAALLAGTGLSAAIEVVQAFVTPLGRSCSTNDWLYNSLGAGLGAALAVAALALSAARGRAVRQPA